MDRSGNLLIILILAVACQSPAHSQKGDTSRLTLVFAGDIMGHDSQIISAWQQEEDTHNYLPCFEYVAPYIRQADIAIGNLEVTFGGPPYSGYPAFSSPDALAGALKDAGFDIMLNANNHALDRGKQGLLRTITVLGQHDLIHTGSFISPEERDRLYPLVIEKNGILLGLLNYTYGTNGLRADTPVLVNYIDTAIIRTDLEKVKSTDPDFIIVTIHWGNEYERVQNQTQKDLAAFMFRHGANAIIGSHPHVIQPVVISADADDTACIRIVVNSLGNFISNQRDRYRDGGLLFTLELKRTDRTRITDYSCIPVWVSKPVADGRETFRLVPANITDEQAALLGFSAGELAKFKQFQQDTWLHLGNIPADRFFEIYPLKEVSRE